MSTSEVFKQFYAKLVKTLPMNDAVFVAELFSSDLLPGNLMDQIKAKETRADKAMCFLDGKIHPDISIDDYRSFDKLLDIMEESDNDTAKNLAEKIRNNIKEESIVNDDGTTTLHSTSAGPDSTTEQVLSKTMKESVAHKITVTSEPPTNKIKIPTALDIAADGLRARYLGQLPTAKTDWPKHFVTSYIRLALVEKEDITDSSDQLNYITTLTLRGGVDRILKKKQPIYDLRDIFHFNDEPIPRLILIMGGPGIGKTTMANEICVKWASDGFLSEDFNIVILVTLRMVQQRSLEYVVIKLIGERAYQCLKESLGAKCLIMLEGLDEMGPDQRQNDSLLMELVKDVPIEFVKAKIVVTSRPNACQELKANRTIEIIGLGDKEIMEFIQNSFPGDTQSVEAFSKQLDEYPQLYSLCYVPMSLVMIVRIFEYNKLNLPSTLTELYRLFIVMTLIREERRKSSAKHIVPTTVVDTAEEVLYEVFKEKIPSEEIKTVLALSKLAYCGYFEWRSDDFLDSQMVKKRKARVIFTESDLIKCGINSTDGHGLLHVDTLYQLTGECVTYNFIHLTVQEFLCAVYMLTLSQEKQHHLLKEYFDDYPNIMTLYCGLTRLDFHQVFYSKLTSSNYSAVTAVHCLYEVQLNTAPHKSVTPFVLSLNHMRLLPYDTLCLSYVCCHYPVIQLNMEGCHIGDKSVGILAKWCLNKNITTKLQQLNLKFNNLTSEGMKHVIKIVTNSPSLRELNVSYNFIGYVGVSLCLQYINTLTKFIVVGCKLSVEGATYIKKMLMENKKLQQLDISGNEIGDDGVRHVTEGLQQNDTVTELMLQWCNISVKGATYIKKMLKENKKLQHLDIRGNEIGDDGVRHVMEGLQQNDTLTELTLQSCNISVKGATYIKKMLMENKKLQHLDISINIIGDDGVRHVMKGLQQNDTLTKLTLQSCNISVKGATYFKKMLMENKKLQHLYIDDNGIGDDGVRHVTEGLQQNDTVTKLMLPNCNISVKGAISISELIRTNHTLQLLDIRANPIGDEGIAVIARTLNNTRISKLDVSYCNITVTGAKLLAESFKNNHTIKRLIMSSNDITMDGAIAILDAAVANGVCQVVIINYEYMSDDKVKELMSILEERKETRGE